VSILSRCVDVANLLAAVSLGGSVSWVRGLSVPVTLGSKGVVRSKVEASIEKVLISLW
jgi:hypothetical protein